MGRYWIRNRGRVQGPFTDDRIQGLLRRGRFNRHFHVSEDKKNWYPAADFPELFAGVGGAEPDDDEGPFRSGGSPFDDEDLAPTKVGGGRKNRGGRPRPRDDDDEFEDDDDDDDLEDDDEDWEDDNSGALSGILNWVEANVKGIVIVLVLLVGGLSWFVFGRESFTQDAADLETLIDVKTKISTAHAMGTNPNQWMSMTDSTTAELASMVSRLSKTASSKDHIKQELLFVARDDIPKMFNELPKGTTDSEQRIMARFSRIEEMIKTQTRQHVGSVITLPMIRPQAPAGNVSGGGPPQNTSGQPAGSAQPNNGVADPASNEQPNTLNPGNSAPGANPQPGAAPQSSNPPPNNNAGNNGNQGVPGRPKPAKF